MQLRIHIGTAKSPARSPPNASKNHIPNYQGNDQYWKGSTGLRILLGRRFPHLPDQAQRQKSRQTDGRAHPHPKTVGARRVYGPPNDIGEEARQQSPETVPAKVPKPLSALLKA